MDKAELSKLLEEKVQEKLKEGYSIPTYALDAASRDRVKRGLNPQSHAIPHENHTAEEWQDYLRQVEGGTYEPERPRHEIEVTPPTSGTPKAGDQACGSVGLWKARRH